MSCNKSITPKLVKSFTGHLESAVQNSCPKLLIYIRLDFGRHKSKSNITCFALPPDTNLLSIESERQIAIKC